VPELEKEIEETVARRIREGFDGFEGVIERCVEYLSDEHEGADLEPLVRTAAVAEWARVREEQASWPVPTDCDRLDRAFAALERSGIVARHNFTCCQTCGHAEIFDEIAGVQNPSGVWGYTFYHMQDTEHAAEGYGLCFAYGAREEGEAALQKVGHAVAEALRREGLKVAWDGSVKKRIEVKEFVWRRRLPA